MRARLTKGYLYLLTFISPIGAAIAATQVLNSAVRKSIFIFCIGLFGLTMHFEGGSDSIVHSENVYEHYLDLSLQEFLKESYHILIFSPEHDTDDDIFIHILSFIAGGILQIPELFFFFISLIYGYFMVNAMEKVLAQFNRKTNSWMLWSLVMLFISYRFIDNLQTVRTWTGLWVLFYGAISYYQTGKTKFAILMFMAPFIHFAYFVMALPAYFILFFNKWIKSSWLILFYGLSFFIGLNNDIVLDVASKTELGKNKINNTYITGVRERKDKITNANLQKNWYSRWGKGWARFKVAHILSITLIIAGFFSRSRMTKVEYGLFATGLLTASMSNLFGFIPEVKGRTLIVAGLFISATAVLTTLRDQRALQTVASRQSLRSIGLTIAILIYIPSFLHALSNMLQYTSTYMIFFPLLSFIFPELDISLRTLIGDII